MWVLAHLPLTMLCPPGADVGESMYPTPEGDGFYSSPTPLAFITREILTGSSNPFTSWARTHTCR